MGIERGGSRVKRWLVATVVDDGRTWEKEPKPPIETNFVPSDWGTKTSNFFEINVCIVNI